MRTILITWKKMKKPTGREKFWEKKTKFYQETKFCNGLKKVRILSFVPRPLAQMAQIICTTRPTCHILISDLNLFGLCPQLGRFILFAHPGRTCRIRKCRFTMYWLCNWGELNVREGWGSSNGKNPKNFQKIPSVFVVCKNQEDELMRLLNSFVFLSSFASGWPSLTMNLNLPTRIRISPLTTIFLQHIIHSSRQFFFIFVAFPLFFCLLPVLSHGETKNNK